MRSWLWVGWFKCTVCCKGAPCIRALTMRYNINAPEEITQGLVDEMKNAGLTESKQLPCLVNRGQIKPPPNWEYVNFGEIPLLFTHEDIINRGSMSQSQPILNNVKKPNRFSDLELL